MTNIHGIQLLLKTTATINIQMNRKMEIQNDSQTKAILATRRLCDMEFHESPLNEFVLSGVVDIQ